MADTSKKTSKTAIIDVAHPGKTPPSPNSKSVIINSRPLLKDPMVVEEADKSAVTDESASRESAHNTDAVLPPKAEPESVASDEKSPKLETPSPEKDRPSADEAEAPADDQPTQAAKDSKAEAAEAEAAAKRQAAVDKLIEGKQYYLPINSVEKRRTKRFILLGIVLSLVLAVAWVDIALDAGIIQLGGIKPVTHFFSN